MFYWVFVSKDNLESLPGNQVSHLLSDSMGRLCIGTNEGLSTYFTDKELFVPIKSSNKKMTI